jgi:hypothetical protein
MSKVATPVDELECIRGIQRWLRRLPVARRKPVMEYIIGAHPLYNNQEELPLEADAGPDSE